MESFSRRISYQNNPSSPLGRISIVGEITESKGIAFNRMRILGQYALVYIYEGGGYFVQNEEERKRVEKGNLLVLFPDVPHAYMPAKGKKWSEFYVVFNGPVFDLWREKGLLNPDHPILSLDPVSYWKERIHEVVYFSNQGNMADGVRHLGVFFHFLTEAVSTSLAIPTQPWLEKAKRLLEQSNAQVSPEAVAKECGLSYENFRKRFKKETGQSPSRYQASSIMHQACHLIYENQLSNKEVAEQLGFCDEFHFSKRFKQVLGYSPREFRQRLPYG